jgi:phosphoglycolate phosphatase-like HAD superfamily hydrolase
MNSLAIFDIDGTLTDTNAVDDACFRGAVADAMGIAPAEIDWTGTKHFTDRAIFDFLWSAYSGRLPAEADVARARDRLTDLLTSAVGQTPDQFRPIAGAPAVFGHLAARGWRVSIATGCWGPSAQIKLRTAGIDIDGIVMACSDDAASRTEIVTLSRARAAAEHGGEFDRVVSIGDGLWDVETAVALGLPFVGVAHGDHADRLRRAGASVVIESYADLDAFTYALGAARVPASG